MKTTIREISHGVFDGPHATPPPSETGAVFLGIGAIGADGYIDESRAKRISEEDLPKWTRRVTPQAGDIVFSYEATLNLYAIIPVGFRGCLGRRIGLIRPDTAKVNTKFLFYYFYSPQWRSFIKSKTVQGATVDRISVEEFPDFSIELPSLETQNRIVQILEPYDSLIENNRRQIKLLEEAAQRLYKEWFVDLRFPGHEHTPITNGIPQGWKSVRVEDVCSVLKRGITPKYDEQAEQMVINQKCIRTSIVSLDEARKHNKTYSAELDVQDGDTLICSTGTGTLGRVGCVHGEYKNTTIDSHVTLVRADKHITNKHYLYHFLKSNQSLLMQSGKGSTNQQELYKEIIGQLKLFLPERTLLHQFDALASAIHQKIASLNSSLKLLSEARDRLLPKLMSGEVEV